MNFIVILEAAKLALDFYKEVKGKPKHERDQIRSLLFTRAQDMSQFKEEVKNGDTSKVEDALSHRSLR